LIGSPVPVPVLALGGGAGLSVLLVISVGGFSATVTFECVGFASVVGCSESYEDLLGPVRGSLLVG
jgi:hypothetical protein